MSKQDHAATLGPKSDRLVNVGEVARHLALSRSKIYQLMHSGRLPYVKLGKSRRVRWPDVLKLIDRSMVGGFDD